MVAKKSKNNYKKQSKLLNRYLFFYGKSLVYNSDCSHLILGQAFWRNRGKAWRTGSHRRAFSRRHHRTERIRACRSNPPYSAVGRDRSDPAAL